ncbi:MAG: nuclear transport factor 2 family protein [bacterium]|nr:MAG: nuclear transport factor 2 family protein [bacterium]
MKTLACFLIMMISIAILVQCGIAQEKSDKDEILTVVQKFFDSMAARDTGMARELLLIDGQYYGVREDLDTLHIKRRAHLDYIESLSETEDEYNERIWNPTVMVHGRIAVVWAQYDFHINGKFTHCGVDAFTLIKTQNGWKIAGAAYTIEPEGCDQSPLGPLKSK